ncbi:molybdenum cofactor biosynthesis protein, partial [Mycobacterium sp. ITM-2017-0098]
RASSGVYEDRCGPVVVEWLNDRGIDTPAPVVVADGDPVAAALSAVRNADHDVIVTSGGTGISPTDSTPQITAALLDYELPGLADAIRR